MKTRVEVDIIDQSGWKQTRIIPLQLSNVKPTYPTEKTNIPTGKIKSRRGRPSRDDSYVYITIGLRPVHWEWLRLWFPSGSPSDFVRALLDRAIKFWPSGPGRFR